MTLRLEVGKKYFRRNGMVATVTDASGKLFHAKCAQWNDGGLLHEPDGAWHGGSGEPNEDDIVAEYAEEQPREHWSKRHPGPIGIECRQCPECGLVPIGHSCLNAERSTCLLDAEVPDTNPKTRVGLTKPGLRGIPSTALLHLGGAMHDGIEKYGQFNWREHTVSASVYEDAIWRHLLAWRDREDIAADSGRHHLAHVMACCAILLDAEEMGKLNDDRGLPGNAPDIIAAWTKKAIDTPS